MTATGIGAPVRRKEDQRFITGQGRYTTTSTARARPTPFVPLAPRPRTSARTTRRPAMPGRRVLTGRRPRGRRIGGLICGWMIHPRTAPMKAGAHPALAQGKVRYVGDHVACGDRRRPLARPGRGEAIGRYEVLPRWSTPRAPETRPQCHDVAPDNTVFVALGDKAAARRPSRGRST
jgi:carbon-monoxide dehydrogenase large subunit